MTLYLRDRGVLRTPFLDLSLFLKSHRTEYYRLLQAVRVRGDWEAGLDFFLTGVAETANQAFDAATRIVDLVKADCDLIRSDSARTGSALRVQDGFQQMPFLTQGQLVKRTGLATHTVNTELADPERLGIVRAITGRQHGQANSSRRYLDILNEGTEPLPVSRLCCTNHVRDSSRESSVVAARHEQTETSDLQDQELARL